MDKRGYQAISTNIIDGYYYRLNISFLYVISMYLVMPSMLYIMGSAAGEITVLHLEFGQFLLRESS